MTSGLDNHSTRYPSHYSRTPVIEQCVHWDRIRAPPIDIPPHNVHTSDCLDKLHPGDHVEIQWRGNKEFPYGWWYGVVGHLETCDEIRSLCRCHKCGHLWEASSMEVICVCVCLFMTPELMFGLYLLYYFRVFERQIGSNKYSLLFSSWKRSILLGICGVLAGLLYRSNIFGIRHIKFPEFVSSLFSRLSWPTLGGSSPSASSGNVIGNVPSYTGREVEGNYPSAALASTMEPSDNSIATLVSMGFDRNSARQALVQARNDVNVATNILLEAQSH